MQRDNSETRGTLRERHALDTRALIVAAAQALFLQKGYVATTMTSIASEAGVAVGTVYLAFGTKRGVLQAIRERWHQGSGIKDVLEQARSLPGARDKLALIAQGTRRQWETSAEVVGIYKEAAATDPKAAEELSAALAGRRVALGRFVDDMAPFLRPGLAVSDAAAVLRALCRVEVYDELVRESGWSADTYERWLSDALALQLLPETERS